MAETTVTADTSVLEYIDYGAYAAVSGPFTCAGGKFQGMLVQGDGAKLDAFVDKVFNATAPQGVSYERFACLDMLVMLIGNFAKVNATAPKYVDFGAVREVQLSFWLPLCEWTTGDDGSLLPRIVLAVPYIFVDNPMSYVGGREDYGYPKVMGQFDPPTGLGETVTVNAYGGDFGRGAVAGWTPFMKLAPGDSNILPEPRAAVGNFEEFVDQVSGGRLRRGQTLVIDNSDGPRSTVPAADVDTVLDDPTQVFLKQFRHYADPGTACYRQIVDVPLEVTMQEVSGIGRGPTDLTFFELESHPITTELGIGSQAGLFPYTLEMSFNVLAGREPPAAATTTRRFTRDS
jgi:hypothetical protein